jgi:hypothetical protein
VRGLSIWWLYLGLNAWRSRVAVSDADVLWWREVREIPLTAGFASGIALLMALSVMSFWYAPPPEKVKESLGIVLVALAATVFLHPVMHRIGLLVDVPEDHVLRSKSDARVAALGIAGVTTALHGLLEGTVADDPWEAANIVLASSLIAGGITYLWLVGSHARPRRSAKLGAIGGALISAALLTFRIVFTPPTVVPADVWAELPVLLVSVANWTWLGFCGGLMLDRRWAYPRRRGVMLGFTLPAAVFAALVVLFMPQRFAMADAIVEIARSTGWGLGFFLAVPAITGRRLRAFVVPVQGSVGPDVKTTPLPESIVQEKLGMRPPR